MRDQRIFVIPIQCKSEIDVLHKFATGDVNVDELATIKSLVASGVVKLSDLTREARVVVSNEQLAVGSLQEMRSRFASECSIRSSATVQLQEWRDGQYVTLSRQRPGAIN